MVFVKDHSKRSWGQSGCPSYGILSLFTPVSTAMLSVTSGLCNIGNQ